MICPFCDSDNCNQTTETDVSGDAEYHCEDCGEYFVATDDENYTDPDQIDGYYHTGGF